MSEIRTAFHDFRVNMVDDSIVTPDIHVIKHHATIQNVRGSVKRIVTQHA